MGGNICAIERQTEALLIVSKEAGLELMSMKLKMSVCSCLVDKMQDTVTAREELRALEDVGKDSDESESHS